MRPELETYHLIDRYLNGELSGNELLSFETQMSNDATFVQEIELQKLTNSVIEGAAYDQLRQQMRADIKAFDAKKTVARSLWRRIAAGTTILFAVGSGYYFYDSSENVLEKTQNIDTQSDKPTLQTPKITPKIEADILKLENRPKAVAQKSLNTAKQKSSASYLNNNTHQGEIVEIPIKGSGIPPRVENLIVTKPSEPPILPTHSQLLIKSSKTEESVESNSELVTRGTQVHKTTEYTEKKSMEMKRFTVHISAGESWRIPVEEGIEFNLQVVNSAGVVVYRHSSTDARITEWEGTASNGALLESGVYVYIIEYPDNTKEAGQITLIK